MKMKICAIILVAFVLNNIPSFAQDFYNEDTISFTKILEIKGSYAFYGKGESFAIADLKSPGDPVELAEISLGAKVFGLEVVGNYLYIANGEKGLRIFDISTPQKPVEVGGFSSYRVYDVDVSKRFAYLACGPEGLKIIDVMNPLTPVQAGFFVQRGDAYRIFVQGDFAYLSSKDDGVQIINIENPIDPRVVSSIKTSNETPVIRVYSNIAYITDLDLGLKIYDISKPELAIKIGEMDFESSALDLYFAGGIAYITDGEYLIYEVDVSFPENIVLKNTYSTKNQGGGINVLHDYIYYSDGLNPLSTYAIKREIIKEEESAIEQTSPVKPPRVDIQEAKEDELSKEKESKEELMNNWNSIERWAVIIGISDYQYPEIPDLKYADNDALALHEFLMSPQGGGFRGENIILMLNEDATTQNIRDALFVFLKNAKKTDLVFIYFSGHGAPEYENPNNMYLITYDTDPSRLSSTAFPMWDIQTALNRHIIAERVIVMADACHSGAVGEDTTMKSLKPRNLVNKYLLELSKSKPGRVSFTASKASELSQESERWGGGHGVFTYFFLEGLKGDADINGDNIINIGEAIDFTRTNVIRVTGSLQNPETAGNFDRRMPISIIK